MKDKNHQWKGKSPSFKRILPAKIILAAYGGV